MTPRPIRLRLRLVQWLRRISVRKQQRRQTSAYFHRQRFHQAIADRIRRQDELRRETRGSRRVGLVLGNCRILYWDRSTVGSLEPTRFQLSLTVIGGIRTACDYTP